MGRVTALHPSIAELEMPPQIEALPRSRQGFPVPWFVAFIDGEPDFRIIRPDGVGLATRHGLCWLCGHELGMTATYVAGPMCGVNRTSAEPPSHNTCADYAAVACPFLTRPHAKRRPPAEEIGAAKPPGQMIERNPGVTMLWTGASVPLTRGDGQGRTLLRLPDPMRVRWFCEARQATFEEVKASIESGMPILKEAADAEGPDAVQALFNALKALYPLLPREREAVAGGQ